MNKSKKTKFENLVKVEFTPFKYISIVKNCQSTCALKYVQSNN